eukprot:291004_1
MTYLMHVLFYLIGKSGSHWMSHSNPSLLQPAVSLAVGSHNGSIYLLGGGNSGIARYQITEYRIDSNTMIDQGNALPQQVYGYGSYYTQVDHLLYMINPNGRNFSVYNMETRQISSQLSSVVIPIHVNAYGCLAATTTHLIVTGGQDDAFTTIDRVQMLNLQTHIWENTLPVMNQARRSHSCIVNPSTNALYCIGGHNGTSHLASIERVYTDSDDASWSYIGYLTIGLDSTRTVFVYESNIIWIIGGGYFVGRGVYTDRIHTIDTVNDVVSLSSESLPYAVLDTAAVLVDNVLYCFGGRGSTHEVLSTWMSYKFPTVSPTPGPTLSPTSSPTAIPIIYPTHSPESAPIIALSAPNTTMNLDDEEHSCHKIDLEIINFEGISSWDFSQSTRLQDAITNITKNGIHEVVSDAYVQNEKLIETSFYVEFVGASGSPNIEIEQDLCAWSQAVLTVLSAFIEDEYYSIEIAQRIKNGLVQTLQGNLDMNVTISLQQSNVPTGNGPTQREISSLTIALCIIGIFLGFSLFAWFDAKFLRHNDYFLVQNIVSAGLGVCDTVLDLLFAVTLTLHFNETQDIPFLVAMIAAYTFIVLPIMYSIVQLVMKSRQWWQSDDNLRIWWMEHSNVLYFLSVITGSSYTAVSTANCNAFQLELFSMGLNKQQRLKFNTKRVYGIVCLENIPQVVIQIWYLITVGMDWTALLSIISSITSIIVTALTICTQRTLIRNQQFAKISFNVCCKEMKPSVSTKINGVKTRIGLLLGINHKLIEIPRAKLGGVAHGLKLNIYLFINDIDSKDLDYKTIIREALRNGQLMEIIREEWELTLQMQASISNLQFEDIKSRIQEKNSSHDNAELVTLNSKGDDSYAHDEAACEVKETSEDD